MKKLSILFCSLLVVIALTAWRTIGFNQGGTPIYATLLGENERPGPGDPDGFGTFEMTLNLGQGILTYVLTTEDIAPATAAHIHVAPPSAAGPVLIPLTPPTSGISSGTIDLKMLFSSNWKQMIKDLRQNPEDYYVNVHNADYPPGAIRGQLSKHK